MAGSAFGVTVFVMPSDSNLSPVPRYNTFAQYSLSANGGAEFDAAFYVNGTTLLTVTGYTIEMLIDTPSAPPGFEPPGSSNVFRIKMPMDINSQGTTAYVPNFSAIPSPGLYTLNFYLFGSPNYVSLPCILMVTV